MRGEEHAPTVATKRARALEKSKRANERKMSGMTEAPRQLLALDVRQLNFMQKSNWNLV
jgi:hypothetical protein